MEKDKDITVKGTFRVNYSLPKNFKKEDYKLFHNDLEKHFSPTSLVSLKDVNITPDGIVFKGLRIFKEFLIWPQHSGEFNVFYLFRNYLRRKKRHINTEVIVCFDYWSSGYFHWLCDFLPRLFIAAEFEYHNAVLLPDSLKSPFVESSLKAFGVSNIIRFSKEDYVHCEKAIIPEYVTPSGDTNPEVMLKIRAKLIQFYFEQISNKIGARNIYVSRAKTKGRFVTNEEEVIKVLTNYNFEIIFFEDYSFVEQMALCYHAQNLIGIHGANLTNILFMQLNSNVMELRRSDDNINNYYFKLATGVKLNYYYQLCSPTNISNDQTFDLTVNIGLLEQNVKRMLGN